MVDELLQADATLPLPSGAPMQVASDPVVDDRKPKPVGPPDVIIPGATAEQLRSLLLEMQHKLSVNSVWGAQVALQRIAQIFNYSSTPMDVDGS